MSRTVNPILIRLGLNKTWSSNYFENIATDISDYNIKDIRIKQFITQFLKSKGILAKKIKTAYSENQVKIFISYFSTSKFLFFRKKNNQKTRYRLKKKPRKIIFKKKIKKIISYNKIVNRLSLSSVSLKYFFKKEKKRVIMLKWKKRKFNDFTNSFISYLSNKRKKRLGIAIKINKLKKTSKSNKQIITLQKQRVFEKLSDILKNYFKDNFKICIILNEIKNLKKELYSNKNVKKKFRRRLLGLRKYQNKNFYNDSIEVLLRSVNSKNSAKILADFIAEKIAKQHRHNYFLKFIVKAFPIFFFDNKEKIHNIKIQIKGRFNGAPRARKRLYKIKKKTSVLKLKWLIDYAESTAYSKNGTFGIKVWIHEKKRTNKVFFNNNSNLLKKSLEKKVTNEKAVSKEILEKETTPKEIEKLIKNMCEKNDNWKGVLYHDEIEKIIKENEEKILETLNQDQLLLESPNSKFNENLSHLAKKNYAIYVRSYENERKQALKELAAQYFSENGLTEEEREDMLQSSAGVLRHFAECVENKRIEIEKKEAEDKKNREIVNNMTQYFKKLGSKSFNSFLNRFLTKEDTHGYENEFYVELLLKLNEKNTPGLLSQEEIENVKKNSRDEIRNEIQRMEELREKIRMKNPNAKNLPKIPTYHELTGKKISSAVRDKSYSLRQLAEKHVTLELTLDELYQILSSSAGGIKYFQHNVLRKERQSLQKQQQHKSTLKVAEIANEKNNLKNLNKNETRQMRHTKNNESATKKFIKTESKNVTNKYKNTNIKKKISVKKTEAINKKNTANKVKLKNELTKRKHTKNAKNNVVASKEFKNVITKYKKNTSVKNNETKNKLIEKKHIKDTKNNAIASKEFIKTKFKNDTNKYKNIKEAEILNKKDTTTKLKKNNKTKNELIKKKYTENTKNSKTAFKNTSKITVKNNTKKTADKPIKKEKDTETVNKKIKSNNIASYKNLKQAQKNKVDTKNNNKPAAKKKTDKMYEKKREKIQKNKKR